MDISLLADWRLLFIALLAAVVSMLTTLNIASRPAAIKTKQVALALAVSSIFFMLTRFANLFYLPILATYVDKAVRTGRVDVLYGQIQWVVVGSALGAFLSWVMLPTFVSVFERGIKGVESKGSMFKVLLHLPTPRGIKALFKCFSSPIQLKGWTKGSSAIPKDFLFWNVVATAIWTVGALCALYVSAAVPKYEATAVLLSGLVNSFAAIAFAVFVDPKAAVITDQAVQEKRSSQDVYAMTYYLGLGNFAGGLCGLFVFPLGIRLIQWATLSLGEAHMDDNMWIVIALNVLVCALMCSTLSSRIAAVITRNVAISLAVYNLFFLITRLTTQVYAPILGAVRDAVVNGTASADALLPLFRWVVWGAVLGTVIGWLSLPTFVEIYVKAIGALERRSGSMVTLIKDLCKVSNLRKVAACLKAPSNFGVTFKDLKNMPKSFLIANVFVVAVHCIGVLAAILAGAYLSGTLARTATLLSSVINGVATILASVVVDPTAARITDQAVAQKRPLADVKAMTIFITLGALVGTVLSQLLLVPSAYLIMFGAKILDFLFHAI